MSLRLSTPDAAIIGGPACGSYDNWVAPIEYWINSKFVNLVVGVPIVVRYHDSNKMFKVRNVGGCFEGFGDGLLRIRDTCEFKFGVRGWKLMSTVDGTFEIPEIDIQALSSRSGGSIDGGYTLGIMNIAFEGKEIDYSDWSGKQIPEATEVF